MQKALPGNTRERIVDLMKAHGMTQAMLAEKNRHLREHAQSFSHRPNRKAINR